MVGKGSLLMILGFILIFVVMGHFWGALANRAVENHVSYFNTTTAHNIAVSGANLAANQIFLNPAWNAGYSHLKMDRGEVNVGVHILDAFKDIKQIYSAGYFNGDSSIVKITFQPSKFSKFAYYSVVEPTGIWWTTGDTVWGPFHTQDNLRVAGNPVFNGKATILKDIIYYNHDGSDEPILNAGFEKGIDIGLSENGITDLQKSAENDGMEFQNKDTVYLTFAGDSIKYKFAYNEEPKTNYLKDFAPNGVLFANDAVLRIEGTIKGRYTVGASGTNGKGVIYLDNDIIYNTDPREDNSSKDLFGIVAQNGVLITDNKPNRDDINIDASIYVQNGGFGAENYNTRPKSGVINLLGGITQYQRAAVGTFSSKGISAGFNKNYRYDDRLMYSYPPFFPNTGHYEIISWYE